MNENLISFRAFFFFLFAFELTYQASTYLNCNYSLLYLKNQSHLNFLPLFKATNHRRIFFDDNFSPIAIFEKSILGI